jgi:hypothetical protein
MAAATGPATGVVAIATRGELWLARPDATAGATGPSVKELARAWPWSGARYCWLGHRDGSLRGVRRSAGIDLR